MEQKKYNVMHSSESSKYVDIYSVQEDVSPCEINQAVYAVLCVVAQAVLDRSTCFLSGERTASELAGYFRGMLLQAVMPLSKNDKHLPMAEEVRVEAGTWRCNFLTKDVFEVMAEWEGIAGIVAKKVYRFQCGAGEHSQEGLELKPYKRIRGYRKPSVQCFDPDVQRIEKKFANLGPMSQDLSSEGMRKAMSVLAAVRQFKDAPYYIYDLAPQVMRRKLWDDYGKKGGMGPVAYCEKDFEYGPEIWKQVDDVYVQVLVAHFRKVLADCPAPEWLEVGSYVQFKNQENVREKYRGKFYVDGMEAKYYAGRIEWLVVIKKDRYRTEQHRASDMEPWVEPEKSGKTQKSKKVSPKSAPGKPSGHEVKKENAPAGLSLTERLRAALLSRLAA